MVASYGIYSTVRYMINSSAVAWLPKHAAVSLGTVCIMLLSGCGGQQVEKPVTIDVPAFGTPSYTLPDRGDATKSWNGFDNSTPQQVLASDMLPAQTNTSTAPDPGGTGDPVADRFIKIAVNLSGREASTLKLKIIEYPKLDPIIAKAIESTLPTLSKMIGNWDDMNPTLLFITKEDKEAETWLRSAAIKEGCLIPQQWYPFQKTEMPGGVPVQNLCGKIRKGFILNISQYTRITPGADLTAVMRTVVDDLFDQWQFQRNPTVRNEGVEPRWLLQGSQQLPFMLYQASRTGKVEFNQIPLECLDGGVQNYDFEMYTPNQNKSCAHMLGGLAMVLLVARVGIDPVTQYFTNASKDGFEKRFADLAGESYDAFSVRLNNWLVKREKMRDLNPGNAQQMYNSIAHTLR